jgi:hypothetical protein
MSTKFEFKIGTAIFQIEDTSSKMNEFFMKFYEVHFASASLALNITEFRAAVFGFLMRT